ncbi:MAG: DUF934 domain-containing protein [Pseudomonadota bacterium]
MPLIKHGRVVDEDWAFAEDDAPLPDGQASVTLARFRTEREDLLKRNIPLGVRLNPEDDPHELEGDLDHLSLIEVSFPKYADGRGYSQAQLLRRRLGYEGELRAVGDVLRDQALLMVRSGFDALELQNTDLPGFEAALAEFRNVYQGDALGNRSVFLRRHGEG